MSLLNYLQSINRQYLILPMALVASLHANAASWVEVGSNDAVVVSVDTDSLRRTGTKVKSWLQWQWSKQTEVPNSYPIKLYLLERQLQISDCKDKTLTIAQGIRYADLNGNEVVDSYTITEKFQQYSEAVPETIGESIIKFVCKATSSKKK